MNDKIYAPRSAQEKNSHTDHSHKMEYTAPNLISYGQVRTLTQAGSGTTTEQKPGQGATSKKP